MSLIKAHNINVTLGGRHILRNTSVDVDAGKILTIIGPNGGGKTTLIKVLLGLLKPESGSVERAEGVQVGYVPQKCFVDQSMPMNVLRFMKMHPNTNSKAIQAALSMVNATHLLTHAVHNLSGGEWQRVLLARAILKTPQVLMLDEPVQGLDYNGEAEFYQLIQKIKHESGCTVVMVSHDLHVVMGATDEVICLNGHVCCYGKPDTVAQHPEYISMFGKQNAEAFAVYSHHHNHQHALDGSVEKSCEDC